MSGVAGERQNRKFLPIIIAAAALLLASAAPSLLLLDHSFGGRDRLVFLFPAPQPSSSGGNPVREARLLDTEGRDPLAAFLSDLLLGSLGREHIQPFASKCSLGRCFVGGSAAYIDISAADFDKAVSDPLFAYKCELFKKNVFTNFKNIDTIYLYFDGVEVYAERH